MTGAGCRSSPVCQVRNATGPTESRAFRHRASAELAITLLVFGDQPDQQILQPLRRERAEDDPVFQLNLQVLTAEVPGLVHPEIDDDFFARAGGVADVAVRALDVGAIETNFRLPRCAGTRR